VQVVTPLTVVQVLVVLKSQEKPLLRRLLLEEDRLEDLLRDPPLCPSAIIKNDEKTSRVSTAMQIFFLTAIFIISFTTYPIKKNSFVVNLDLSEVRKNLF
jgi:hypothetical protein